MATVSVVLLFVSFLVMVAASFLVKVPKVNLVAAGLAIWELAQLILRESGTH